MNDPRLTEWRDESRAYATGVAWRRHWTIGKRYRAAVILDTLQPRSLREPRRPTFTWCAAPCDCPDRAEGKAETLEEAKRLADEALAGFLREMATG